MTPYLMILVLVEGDQMEEEELVLVIWEVGTGWDHSAEEEVNLHSLGIENYLRIVIWSGKVLRFKNLWFFTNSKTGSRAFDRSLSSGGGGSWYADRSASNGPASAGIIGPGGPAEDGTNNGSMSPR